MALTSIKRIGVFTSHYRRLKHAPALYLLGQPPATRRRIRKLL